MTEAATLVRRTLRAFALGVALITVSLGQAVAQTSEPVESLVGSRASGLEKAMAARGYTRIAGYKKGKSSITKWKKRAETQCYEAVARDGRITHITLLSEFNCQ